jgi:predicted HAD superfamily Cof-like phosphohydrolase
VKEIADLVTEFHGKNGYPMNIPLPKGLCTYTTHMGHDLIKIAERLEDLASTMQDAGDARLYRATLLVEEVGELLLGLGTGDEVATLDAAADLVYVLVGTVPVTYNLPLDGAVKEVHRSNMTKRSRTSSDPRMRDKGTRYDKPKLKELIDEFRNDG